MRAVDIESTFTLAAGTLLLLGCASTASDRQASSSLTTLVGKSQAAILSCAGPPLIEIKQGAVTVWRYFREAPMMEESAVSSKGSRPGIHHGCWASLRVEKTQVTGVEFKAVPEGVAELGDCEDIFNACHPN